MKYGGYSLYAYHHMDFSGMRNDDEIGINHDNTHRITAKQSKQMFRSEQITQQHLAIIID